MLIIINKKKFNPPKFLGRTSRFLYKYLLLITWNYVFFITYINSFQIFTNINDLTIDILKLKISRSIFLNDTYDIQKNLLELIYDL